MRMRSSLVYKTIIARRTIRRFKKKAIKKSILKKLVNTARLSPSAANLQPLEFIIINNKDTCAEIFPHLRWAGYITPDGAPSLQERPVAYIAVLINKTRAQARYVSYDAGAACQSILLAAWEQGIGGCWMQAIERRKISKILNISRERKLDSVISLGYRAESPVVEELRDSVKYWKDKKGILHVPKRNLDQIIYKVI